MSEILYATFFKIEKVKSVLLNMVYFMCTRLNAETKIEFQTPSQTHAHIIFLHFYKLTIFHIRSAMVEYFNIRF